MVADRALGAVTVADPGKYPGPAVPHQVRDGGSAVVLIACEARQGSDQGIGGQFPDGPARQPVGADINDAESVGGAPVASGKYSPSS